MENQKPYIYKPTFGFLINQIGDRYHKLIFRAANELCRQYQIRLLWFIGKPFHSPYRDDAEHNAIFSLVGLKNVDGIMILSGALKTFIQKQELQDFLAPYRFMPLVSIAYQLPEIPSITVDQKSGIQEAMVHLIEHHHFTRIAFIGGPEDHWEAQQRYQAYKETLRTFKIPFDQSLVYTGDFVTESGRQAVRSFLDRRKVKPEAIIAANDAMALGALQEIKEHGLAVPEDISLIGFDDIDEAKASEPALTTIYQPIYEIVKNSLDTLIGLYERKKSVKQTLVLPTRLIVRQSCGCLSRYTEDGMLDQTEPVSVEKFLTEAPQFIKDELVKETLREPSILPGHVDRMVEWSRLIIQPINPALDLEGPQEDFFRIVGHLMIKAQNEGIDIRLWQSLFISLKNRFSHMDIDERKHRKLDFLCQKVLEMISDSYLARQRRQQMEMEYRSLQIQETSQALITTFELDKLMTIIENELPGMGIENCAIGLYEGKAKKENDFHWSIPPKTRLALVMNNFKRSKLNPKNSLIDTKDLVYNGKLFDEGSGSRILMPLFCMDEQYGYILFNAGARLDVDYENLRRQISSALRTIYLFQARQNAELELRDSLVRIQESEEKFREMALFLPTAIIETNQDLAISFINNAGYSALGYQETDDLVGQNLLTLVHPKSREKLLIYSESILKKESTPIDEINFVQKNGGQVFFLSKAVPYFKGRSLVGIRWSFMNIKPLLSNLTFPNTLMLQKHKFGPRAQEVLQMTLKGYRTKEISTKLFIAESTVKDYISDIYNEFGVSNRNELFAALKTYQINHFGYESFLHYILSEYVKE